MNMNRFSFSKKLYLLLLLPLTGLILFAAYGIYAKSTSLIAMSKVVELTELSTKISSFVHEMQKERGTTAVYLGSKGKKFSAEMNTQRAQTSKPLQELNSFLSGFDAASKGNAFENQLNSAINDIGQLNGMRDKISSLKISGPEAISYYTATNGKLLNLIGEISILSTSSKISNLNTAYVNFLKGKERAGIERAVLSKAFATDQISDKAYAKYNRLNTERNIYFDNFRGIASTSQIDLFQQKLNLPVVTELQKMRGIIESKHKTGNFQTDVDHWFKTATKRINDLKDIENSISRELLGIAQSSVLVPTSPDTSA